MEQQRPSTDKKSPKKGLSSGKVNDYLRFVGFLTLIGMFYIWNNHRAVRQVRELEILKTEVSDLKSKYLMRESNLRAGMRFSEVSDRVDSLGLRRLKKPAYKLIKSKK